DYIDIPQVVTQNSHPKGKWNEHRYTVAHCYAEQGEEDVLLTERGKDHVKQEQPGFQQKNRCHPEDDPLGLLALERIGDVPVAVDLRHHPTAQKAVEQSSEELLEPEG